MSLNLCPGPWILFRSGYRSRFVSEPGSPCDVFRLASYEECDFTHFGLRIKYRIYYKQVLCVFLEVDLGWLSWSKSMVEYMWNDLLWGRQLKVRYMLRLDMSFKVMTFEIYTPQWSQVYSKGFSCLLFLWRVKFLVYFAFSSHWLHMRCFDRRSCCHFSDSICFLLLDFITMYVYNYYIYIIFL